jgi:hypothetical protein
VLDTRKSHLARQLTLAFTMASAISYAAVWAFSSMVKSFSWSTALEGVLMVMTAVGGVAMGLVYALDRDPHEEP